MDAETSPPPSNPTATISKVTALLVVLLAAGAFLLSFEALRDLAVSSGALSPRFAWAFPLIVDGSVIVFSLSVLRASLVGEDRRWYLGLVGLITLASVGFNMAHASGGLLAKTMAAMPPLLLFAAFESLLRQVYSVVAPMALPSPRKSPARVEPAPARERREKVTALAREGLSQTAISKRLKVSPATVKRDLQTVTKAKAA